MEGEDALHAGYAGAHVCRDFSALSCFLDAAFGGAGGIVDEFPVLTQDDNRSRCFVVESAGQIAAHAAWAPLVLRCGGRELPAAGIGLVATASAHRGCGLASQLVAHCIAQGTAQGAEVALLFGESTLLYARLGFTRAGRERITRLDPDPERSDKRLSAGGPGDAARIHPLLMAHPVGVLRDVARFERLLAIPHTHLYLLEGSQGPLAYCVEGKGRDLRGVIHEWGGAPAHVEALLHAVVAGLTQPLFVLSPECLPAPADGVSTLGAVAQLRVLRPDRLGTDDPRELFGDEQRSGRLPFYVWGLDSI
jgi:predicted N-acetyltransferase YhbS